MTFYPETPSTNGTTSITSRDFTANWKTQQYTLNPLGADRKDVDFYEVQYGTGSSPNSGYYRTERTTKSARSRRFTVSNRGGVYYWRVRGYAKRLAGLGNGWSDWSPSVRIDLPSGIPSAPSSAINGVSSEAINFTWGTASGNGESVSGYQVQRASNSSFSSRVGTVTTSSSARSYRFGGLNRATTYYFRVRARTEGGYGSWSRVRSATTKPTVPSTPRRFVVNPRSNGAVVGIGWVAPSDNGGRSVSRYEIIRWSSRGSVLKRYSYSASTTHTEISGLTPGATYLWSMRAINSVGKGGLTTRLSRKMNRP
ncbi:MAG: fibronectin type III domain-containing protein, partial [Brevibacterium aurantiacum]